MHGVEVLCTCEQGRSILRIFNILPDFISRMLGKTTVTSFKRLLRQTGESLLCVLAPLRDMLDEVMKFGRTAVALLRKKLRIFVTFLQP